MSPREASGRHPSQLPTAVTLALHRCGQLGQTYDRSIWCISSGSLRPSQAGDDNYPLHRKIRYVHVEPTDPRKSSPRMQKHRHLIYEGWWLTLEIRRGRPPASLTSSVSRKEVTLPASAYFEMSLTRLSDNTSTRQMNRHERLMLGDLPIHISATLRCAVISKPISTFRPSYARNMQALGPACHLRKLPQGSGGVNPPKTLKTSGIKRVKQLTGFITPPLLPLTKTQLSHDAYFPTLSWPWQVVTVTPHSTQQPTLKRGGPVFYGFTIAMGFIIGKNPNAKVTSNI